MKAIHRWTGFVLSAAFLSACATTFKGSAHVENGRKGCEWKCKGQGMELVGMVYMGEYSDACVCAVPGQTASLRRQIVASSGSVAAAAAGVITQMRTQAAQQQQQAN